MKSLMYFVVLDPSNTVLEEEVMNIYWRGLCVETSVPGQFCEPPRATWTQAYIYLVFICIIYFMFMHRFYIFWTQATLVAPLFILLVLFLPSTIYMIVYCVCNAKRDMRVVDHAVLFIFPILTNLCFNFNSETPADRSGPKDRTTFPRQPIGASGEVKGTRSRPGGRSHSCPNNSTCDFDGIRMKRQRKAKS